MSDRPRISCRFAGGQQMNPIAQYAALVKARTEAGRSLLEQLDAMERNIAELAAATSQLAPPPVDELRASRAKLLRALEELENPFVVEDRFAELNPLTEVIAFLLRAQRWLKTIQQGQQSRLN